MGYDSIHDDAIVFVDPGPMTTQEAKPTASAQAGTWEVSLLQPTWALEVRGDHHHMTPPPGR